MSLLYPCNGIDSNIVQKMIWDWDWDNDPNKKKVYLKGIIFDNIPLKDPLRYFVIHELRKRYPLDFSEDRKKQNILYKELCKNIRI